jgi:glycosyltransferase involved in cell wall biosynthesis
VTQPNCNTYPENVGDFCGLPSPNFRVIRAYQRLPPMRGGMETHIAELTRAQRALGIEVTHLYQCGDAEGAAVRVLGNCPLHSVKPAALRNLIFFGAAMRARAQLRTNQPTVLHVHGDWSDFLYSRPLSRVLNINLVAASIHGPIRRNFPYFYRSSLAHCKLIFVTGKSEQIYLENLLERAVHHLPSAPADVFFQEQMLHLPSRYDVISVGTLANVKRFDIILACAEARPQYRFAIYGDGPLREKLRETIRISGIRNLDLPGQLTPSEIKVAMHEARLFLSTSEKEGTPTAALEAMASGLPVVLTPSNQYSWLVTPHVNGFVTSGWDLEEIMQRIDCILSDEPGRAAIGEANRVRARAHSWQGNAERVSGLMAEHLAGRR